MEISNLAAVIGNLEREGQSAGARLAGGAQFRASSWNPVPREETTTMKIKTYLRGGRAITGDNDIPPPRSCG